MYKMMTANEIRDSYLKFFESKGHVIVPSAPIVVKDDPTLMFTNAGMNQWKDIILGTKEPEPRRRTDSQKCLRVSGKHNDLEEVGRDSALSHHTMFEMLGNWSFGDYFKEGAIDYAYEYLVDVLHLDPKDLYVTVFEGDPAEGITRDDEAAGYWAKHFPENHIVNGNKHDNFWEMGDTGPCGPCSEIHIDFRSDEEKAKVPGEQLVNKDHPQVIEIWNIVFMQFNRKADGSLEPLKMHVIDTGLGFERLVRLLQGKNSNYDTDIFTPIIAEIERLSGKKYNHTFPEGPNGEGVNEEEKVDIAIRVVADHLRAVAFAIADGQLPSNAKAGYVIRRILRRAVRYSYTFLGQKQAFMYKLLPVLVREMGEAYPELKAQQELIGRVMKQEEESFLRTLENGIQLLTEDMDEMRAAGKKELDGSKAFRLFDTYGFPLDLTELILGENGFTVDEKQFDAEMAQQKARARNAAAVENGDWVVLRDGEQEFVGYDYTEYECHILRYRKVVQKKNTFYEVVLDHTPFYGEMGGQVGDRGDLVSETETVHVVDTKRENNQSIHIIKKLPENPQADFMACVDTDKREGSACNHTATHLLDYALKQVLGEQVEQKGSYVDENILRFDFNYFEKVDDEKIRQVERIVNKMIREDLPLDEHRDTPIDEARKLGAIALFGEKYGDKVRVVRFGPSVEFCGGIHVKSTGHIGFFKIISESSVAAGIRRVEALTGKAAEEAVYTIEDTFNDIRALFNNAKDLRATIEKSINENSNLKKEVESFRQQRVEELKTRLVNEARDVNGIKVVSAILPIAANSAKDLVFKVREAIPENLVCVIGSIANDKPLLSVMLSEDMVKDHGLNAGKIVREAAKLIKGGGGGQPHYAQAGGKDKDGIAAAVDKVIELCK
ncbi:alanine--tRNA ligase [Prevotella lacticifex]|uniref:Alanine--tRNA ligase n=2 Tax=Prevotella lacticifex TaxID=2854755 RepID=A0A9R1C928_9BACT|nr:alanine--tRNA ligase [Prevotella lacticifex]GJG39904.1 alanine--tRNA ligase [Prevotella lacticifex]GJG41414.1 alanine--tRNA ligase [Prevotella lacticifex]GJG46258.1 alanine--tRNA ligase [Prevotella lacticifex]GJG47766.1 alanine--tRNA ligase [Prevotella lacticifex]